MPISCDPNDLAELAKCFSCLNPVQLAQVQTYLLALLAGGSVDPNTLVEEARCFKCLNPVLAQEIKTYLLCQYANA